MDYNKFLEIVLSLFYKNANFNCIQLIRHKNIVLFSISDYIEEIFNENPQNFFFIKEIITNVIIIIYYHNLIIYIYIYTNFY